MYMYTHILIFYVTILKCNFNCVAKPIKSKGEPREYMCYNYF